MTSPIADEVTRRRGAPRKPRNMASALGAACLSAALALGCTGADEKKLVWPSDRYRADPVAFFREIVGVEPWAKQVEVINLVRDNPRVAVAAGHKVSKSHTAAGVALWFYSSFEDARVVLTSTTSRQVDQILWRELRMMVARGGRCVDCKKDPSTPRPCPHSALIDGELMLLARSGLKAPDFREVVGFTAREAEAVAGISGKNLLYIADEASGIEDAIFEAIEGNRAGGARVLMFSNPTRTEGEFAAAFMDKAEFYATAQISSEDSPNVVEGREIIPGLATREWVEEKKREWGEESALYKVRVQGQFVLKEDGKIFSVHAIGEAEARWETTAATGNRLQIGIDPAGPGLGGDESAFSARRGQKQVALLTHRGLTEEAHLVHLLGMIGENVLKGDQPPIVCIDREGPVGMKVYSLLLTYLEKFREEQQPFVLIGVRSSDRAHREPQTYDRVRDELWACAAQWLREGGAILEDTKFAKELHAPEWVAQVTGRLKVTPKDELRKALGRSPDRADAFALSVWESSIQRAERAEREDPADDAGDEPIDPYRGGGIDPYGAVT